MSVSPQTLTNIDSSAAWAGPYIYKYSTSDSSYHYYGLYNNINNYSDERRNIKVEIATDTWSDAGSIDPVAPVLNSDGTISLFNSSGTLLYRFTKPTTASWISNGGGGDTTTEGVNNVTVQWDPNPVCGQQTWVSVLHSEFLSTDTTYSINDSTGQIGTVTVAANTNTTAHAFWFTVTSGLVTVNGSNGDLYGSKVFNCDISSRKKVSLNFW